METVNSAQDLRYPIGEFIPPVSYDASMIQVWILDIQLLPLKLSEMTSLLSEQDLNKVYRPGGWTIKQVIHHCADSHMNSFIRCKLALTEENPTIRPYNEGSWALTSDVSEAPISWSINLLDGLHKRWVRMLKSLSEEDMFRTFFHPEHKKEVVMFEQIAFYAWHSRHHLEHVKQALKE